MVEQEDFWSAAWHTRRNGLVQGPFSLPQMRRMRDLGWLSRVVPVSVDMVLWRPAGEFAILWNDGPPTDEAPIPAAAEPWRYKIDGHESSERVTFAMLQVMAASGALLPAQFVWREGMHGWRPAGGVRGLFGGPSDWCPRCDAAFPRTATSCPSCGRPQQPFEPSHRDIIVPCAVLGVCLFPLVPLWALAIALARWDLRAIDLGRVDPTGREAARIGELLGWCGCLLMVTSSVVVAACFAWNR